MKQVERVHFPSRIVFSAFLQLFPFLSFPIVTRWKKGGKPMSSLVALVKDTLTAFSTGQIANVIMKTTKQTFLYFQTIVTTGVVMSLSPWGKPDLETNNFEKTQRTNVENSTLSRNKRVTYKKSIYWRLLLTIPFTIQNLNWTLSLILLILL